MPRHAVELAVDALTRFRQQFVEAARYAALQLPAILAAWRINPDVSPLPAIIADRYPEQAVVLQADLLQAVG